MPPRTDADTSLLRTTMGARYREARKVLGLSQARAAGLIGMSGEYYARLERGHALPSVPTLVKIADAFRVRVDWLLGFDVGPTIDLAMYRDPPTIRWIVSKVRHDLEAIRVIVRILKYVDPWNPRTRGKA